MQFINQRQIVTLFLKSIQYRGLSSFADNKMKLNYTWFQARLVSGTFEKRPHDPIVQTLDIAPVVSITEANQYTLSSG